MQTHIPQALLDTVDGAEANRILRSCVHCGFCTATCPTYQELGDELDGPRGRIYLIKDMLEGGDVSEKTQQHLDRCLTCRACETTCPSGVEYGHLLEIGKSMVEEKVKRPWQQRLLRMLLLKILPNQRVFSLFLTFGRLFRAILPQNIQKKIPQQQKVAEFPQQQHARKILLIEGCVQPVLSPEIDVATATVLDVLKIQVLRTQQAQCCGAVENHMQAKEAGLQRMRANIDAWMPYVDEGVEAIVSTASACALEIKSYAYLLRNDAEYAEKASLIAQKCKDIAEILAAEDLTPFHLKAPTILSFHAPCTLQHGQQLTGKVEAILTCLGYVLNTIQDAHLCCGSAGTYSLLQPALSQQLRDNKLKMLQVGQAECIATANIGCLHHLDAASTLKVVHWITLLKH